MAWEAELGKLIGEYAKKNNLSCNDMLVFFGSILNSTVEQMNFTDDEVKILYDTIYLSYMNIMRPKNET